MNRPYSCEIDISFPTAICAQQARDVLQVDEELTDSVIKSFSWIRYSESATSNHTTDDKSWNEECTVLRVYVYGSGSPVNTYFSCLFVSKIL
jgi:hypothetical protein